MKTKQLKPAAVYFAVSAVSALVTTPCLAQSYFGVNGAPGFTPAGAIGSVDDPEPPGSPSGSGKASKSSGSGIAQSAASPSAGGGGSTGGGMPGPTDFTADEKRMQRKMKANMSHAKQLIAKGEAMMKAAPNKEDKEYKKGRIFKEVGEKALADLQSQSTSTYPTEDQPTK